MGRLSTTECTYPTYLPTYLQNSVGTALTMSELSRNCHNLVSCTPPPK